MSRSGGRSYTNSNSEAGWCVSVHINGDVVQPFRRAAKKLVCRVSKAISKIHRSGGLSHPRTCTPCLSALVARGSFASAARNPFHLWRGKPHDVAAATNLDAGVAPGQMETNEDEMGEVILLRDFQQKRDLDRLYAEVTQELAPIVADAMSFNEKLAVWPDFSTAGRYHAPDEDPA